MFWKKNRDCHSRLISEKRSETTILFFLKSFRRRGCLRFFLSLCFWAAFLNEAGRWAAVGLNQIIGTNLPVMSVGPLFLIIVFALGLRKRSLQTIAMMADSALAFKDRFVSFSDFLHRADIPGKFRNAQAEETVKALGTIRVPQILPISRILLAGPFLLIVSLSYPLFLSAPSVQFAVYHSPVPQGGRLSSFSGQKGERNQSIPPLPQTQPKPGPKASSENVMLPSPSSTPEKSKATPGKAGGQSPGAKPGPDNQNRGGFRANDTKPSSIRSITIGEKLSKIIDPVFSPSPGEKKQLSLSDSSGLISYRLVPAKNSRRNREENLGNEKVTKIVVDFTSIPERYRLVVNNYLKYLGWEPEEL